MEEEDPGAGGGEADDVLLPAQGGEELLIGGQQGRNEEGTVQLQAQEQGGAAVDGDHVRPLGQVQPGAKQSAVPLEAHGGVARYRQVHGVRPGLGLVRQAAEQGPVVPEAEEDPVAVLPAELPGTYVACCEIFRGDESIQTIYSPELTIE